MQDEMSGSLRNVIIQMNAIISKSPCTGFIINNFCYFSRVSLACRTCTYLIEMDGIMNPKRNVDCKIKRNSQSLLKRVMQRVHTQMMVNYAQLHTSYSVMHVDIGAFPKFTIFT